MDQQKMSKGQKAYEERRAAKAGMSLDKWLNLREREKREEAAAAAKAVEAAKAEAAPAKPPGFFKRLLERTVVLDGTVQSGGPHRSLAQYLHEAPGIMGGDDVKAGLQAEAAVRVDSRFADNLVVRAIAARCPSGQHAACRLDLETAAGLPDDAVPGSVPEQRRGKEWARAELKKL